MKNKEIAMQKALAALADGKDGKKSDSKMVDYTSNHKKKKKKPKGLEIEIEIED